MSESAFNKIVGIDSRPATWLKRSIYQGGFSWRYIGTLGAF